MAHIWARWLHHSICGSPTLSAGSSPLPSSGAPNAVRGDKFWKWLRGPHVGKVATSPLPSWGCPTPSTGTKIGNGHVAHMWTKWLHHLCCLGGPQRGVWGQKSEIATWPTCGQNGYITAANFGVPIAKRGDKNQQCLPGPHVGKVATSPLTSWWSATLSAGTKPRIVYVAQMWAKWPHHALPSWGSPTLSAGTKIRNTYVAHMWAKWLHHPCRLGGPQRPARGQKSEMARWPNFWRGGNITRAVFGVPNAHCGDKNQKWRCGPHAGKVATSPLLSWGSATLSARTKIRNGYVALMWAKWLHIPCYLGGPQRCLEVCNA